MGSDYYQNPPPRPDVSEILRAKLDAIGNLLSKNGCDCGCDHHPDEHSDECERCLACRISEVVHAEMKDKCDSQHSASMTAFDAIAKLCGCPEWNYPGQLVRDVETMATKLAAAEESANLHARERDTLLRVIRKMREHADDPETIREFADALLDKNTALNKDGE